MIFGLLFEGCELRVVMSSLVFVGNVDEDEAIVGYEGNLRCDEVKDDDRGLNNQGLS